MGSFDGQLAILELDQGKVQKECGSRRFREGFVEDTHDIAVAPHDGVVEISLQPRSLCSLRMSAEQVSIKGFCLDRIQHDDARVPDTRPGIGILDTARFSRRRRALIEELDVETIRIGEIGDRPLGLSRRGDQLGSPGARPQQAARLQLRP